MTKELRPSGRYAEVMGHGSGALAGVLAAVLAAVVATGCATGGAPRHGTVRRPVQPDRRVAASEVIARAAAYTGAAYRSGGSSPTGFDCSGFVQYVYAELGVSLPRTVRDQFAQGRKIKDAALQPGDLVFFRTEGSRVSHVGLWTGDGDFIHAPNTRSQVRRDRLAEGSYWGERYAGARRVID